MSIELKQLTKRYGSLTAVDAIDLDVADGEVLCLLGPSGCGKTTTLRMVAGLETATSGDVLLQGNRVNDQSPRERNVAMSFQFYALYPSLSVAENLAFPLHAERMSKAEIDERVARVAGTASAGRYSRPHAGAALRRRKAARRGGAFYHSGPHLLSV